MILGRVILVLSFLSVLVHSVTAKSKVTEDHRSFQLKISKDSEEGQGAIETRREMLLGNEHSEDSETEKEQERIITRYRRQRPTPPRPDDQVCPGRLSCKNNCSSPRHVIIENQLSCFCDNDCEFFKDCCADFDEYCSPSNNSEMSNQKGLVTSANKDLWGCYYGDKVLGIDGFWMIGSCPTSWPKDDIFFQCIVLSGSNKITKDNYKYLPVYTSNGRVYHNRFCAQCNGIKSKDFKDYKLLFGCSVMLPKFLSREKKIEFLFNHCEADNIHWVAPEQAPRRFCISLVKRDAYGCHRDFDGKCTNGSARIVAFEEKSSNYKNKYCADLCGGTPGKYLCGPLKFFKIAGHLPPQPFSVIFDFKDDSEEKNTVKINCPARSPFYDPFLQICRTGRSPSPEALQQPGYEEYEVILWLKSSVPTDFIFRNTIRRNVMEPKTAGEILNIKEQQLGNCKMSSLTTSLFTFKFNLNVTLDQDNNTTRIRRSLEISNHHYMDRIINFDSPFELSYLFVNFTVSKVTKRIIGCANLQKYSRQEYAVSSSDESAVVITKTKELLKSNEFYTFNDSKPKDSPVIFICRHHRFKNCSGKWVLMNEGEFIILENKSVFVNSSNHVFDLRSYVWKNHSVFICENFSTSYHEQNKKTKKTDVHLLNLTYVCMSISIIALVFALVTYCLFTELRTPPGINLMNLSVSILLAQLLWLLGSGQTDKPMACTAIAVLLHYFFLVSFVWTSIIAFDTWRAFTAKGARSRAGSKRSKLMHRLRYMAVGWLSVMAYVALCVVLDVTKAVDIGYQSGNACWMSNPKAILYFFATPIALILIFNIVFYVLTLKAIKASTAQARAATDHKDRKSSFGIYVRIASVMGFTWVFGFVAPFGAHFLWYFFVILNCLQGLYIALAFGLNQRARTLYKNRFPVFAHFSTGNTINTDTTKSTSNFEKHHEEHKTLDTRL